MGYFIPRWSYKTLIFEGSKDATEYTGLLIFNCMFKKIKIN